MRKVAERIASLSIKKEEYYLRNRRTKLLIPKFIYTDIFNGFTYELSNQVELYVLNEIADVLPKHFYVFVTIDQTYFYYETEDDLVQRKNEFLTHGSSSYDDVCIPYAITEEDLID